MGFADALILSPADHMYNFAFSVHSLPLVDSAVVISSAHCCNIKLYQVLSLKLLYNPRVKIVFIHSFIH